MRKKNIVLIVVLLIVIIAVVWFAINNNSKKERIKAIYENIANGKDYICIIQDNDNIKTIAKKGEEYYIDDVTNKKNEEQIEHITTIVKSDKMYYILHNREEYYVYPNNSEQKNILLNEFEQILKNDEDNDNKNDVNNDENGKINDMTSNGKEKINGKNYYFEEYNGIFIFSNDLEEEQEKPTTKFYFKGNKLEYMKITCGNGQKIRKIEINYEVADDLFVIPSNYAEVTF